MTASDETGRFRALLSQRAAHAKRILSLGPEVMHPLSDVVRRAHGWDDVPADIIALFRRAELREPWRRASEMPLP